MNERITIREFVTGIVCIFLFLYLLATATWIQVFSLQSKPVVLDRNCANIGAIYIYEHWTHKKVYVSMK